MKPQRKSSAVKLIGISFFASVCICAIVIFVANDVFSLVPCEREETVIVPEHAGTDEISSLLAEKGLIRFPIAYRLYAKFRSFGENYLSGEFQLNASMSYDELRMALSPKKGSRAQTKITIPEGLTTDEIIELFVSAGIGTKEGFVNAINHGGDFGYDFISEIPENEGRTYRLDGYLFPDTYFFYVDSTETEVISKLLAAFNRKFDEELRAAAKEKGYTVDEILRIASIVEREAYYRSDMPAVASVFLNRLKSKRFSRMESDATVKYIKTLSGDTSAPTAEDIDTLNHPYNTYKIKGLPPGAICSPGYDAIFSAVYPAETDYFYFVSAKDKSTVFSRTYAEHLRAVASLR
ncbi:MAG: endolytic transglycosylase MltG [Ruminococcaceae bacterium]|nr:endolytic transglycosylase MltG [Oscillospiraceae bacterium]